MGSNEFVTVKEIAEAIGVTIQGVHFRAKEEGWRFEVVNGRGDKRFLLDGLPPDIRARVIQARESSYIKGMILPSRADLDLGQAKALLDKFENAPEWSRHKAEARGEIIEAFDRFVLGQDKGLTKAKKVFVRQYNAGNDGLGISGQTYLIIDKVSRPTLDRWRADKKMFGLAGLLASSRNREKFGGLTPEMKQYIIVLKSKKILTRPVRICEYLSNKFSNHDLPSGATVRRFIQEWELKNAELVAYLKNPDKWRSDYQIAFGDATEKAKYFLHMMEFDNTPADLMCADGRRYTITAAIDIFSRKAKCLVVPTSKSQAIANLMRNIIIEWGLFDVMIMDNGSDYASKHIEACCGALGIETNFLPPFTPEGKPHIERFIWSIAMMLFEELSGYVGHSVAERKAIESQKSFAQRMFNKDAVIECRLMPDELQGVIDTWIDKIYHQRTHGGLGKSPEVRAGESGQPVKKILNERVLDILLAPVGQPTVLKKGIRYENGHYVAPELGDFINEKVQIRRDLADAGTLYVFDRESRFICIAKDASLEGMSVDEINIARARQKKRIREQVKGMKALAKEVGDPMMELLEAKAEAGGRVFGFRREEAFENSAMKEASKALAGSEEEEFFTAEAQRKEEKVVPLREEPFFESRLERYKYLQVQGKIRTMTEREKGFIEGYEGSEEYYRIFVMPYE